MVDNYQKTYISADVALHKINSMNTSIADIRKDYILKTLSEHEVKANAIDQFTEWWNEAVKSEIDEVNAMTLSTITLHGTPASRIVLLKDYDADGFVFFTNYSSSKGQEIANNPAVCLLFFWKELERMVRIDGVAEKVAEAESDAYFHSRPVGSRIGAWCSPQSKVISSRKVLEDNVEMYAAKFADGNVPRPDHWGGYRVKPKRVEFWQGRSSRLHDRILYTLQSDKQWKIERVAP